MLKICLVLLAFFSPLILAGLVTAQEAERYRARITGNGPDGSALTVGINYDFSSRQECQNAADKPPISDIMGRLKKAEIADNLNVQCRKLPNRSANITQNPNVRTPASAIPPNPNTRR